MKDLYEYDDGSSLGPGEASEEHETGNRPVREGYLFVCGGCGKTSNWRYGFASTANMEIIGDDGKNIAVTMPGWDESCMLNANEIAIERLVRNAHGYVIDVLPIQ